ncbi:Nucleotide-sugar transporter family protein [Hibiscus syriacus]|uniref:Nucleotide-sugar transporter family protein n=1 Tax=Hibiscus syriacus TaxID=106335 RepID=A0A6A2ZVE2_HIBSY|nr:Nucleotide-sugar transporter family protein [Hibiscus syriacus]
MDPYKHRPSSAFNSPFWTNSGAPVWNNNSSLTVGARGPILLEDYHLVEKLANLIGNAFQNVLSMQEELTPLIVRFSTVIHERGSPETLRDLEVFPRITGTWMALVSYLHTHQQGWEGTLREIPLEPTCGVKNLLEDEAVRVGGANHSHATQDLYDSIAAGSYPEWKLFIQIMDPADEDRFDFDPLDVTKTWPEDIFPLQPVGRMVLNKNIDNFFAENEQLAFCPSIIVPGFITRMISCSKLESSPTPTLRGTASDLIICSFRPMLPNVFITIITMKVNFPSRYDPVRHAETYPIPTAICSGKREKENNFKQLGKDTDPLHRTGKNVLFNAGLMHCLIQGLHMRFAVFGYHTGHRLANLWVRNWLLASV